MQFNIDRQTPVHGTNCLKNNESVLKKTAWILAYICNIYEWNSTRGA
ncbi:MAG: hypothetical protein ACJA2M_001150 [Polaribacter sp.]|jgi:hypothetical protein